MPNAIEVLEEGGLITIDKAAEMLSVHRRTVQRYIQAGRLTVADRIQYVVFLDADEVEKMTPPWEGRAQRGVGGSTNSWYDPFNIGYRRA